MEAPRRMGRTVKINATSDVLVSSTCANGAQTDATPSIRDALLQMCCKDSFNLGKPHVGSVLNVISKHIEKRGCDSIELDCLDFFICLRIPLINDSKAVRAAGLRVIRLCLKNEEYAKKLVEADLQFFIAKCLDVLVDNLAERAQALRLCRRLLLVDPSLFPIALARSIVALAFDGTKEKDRLVRASLAILAELCIVNPSVFVASGGVRCFSSAVLDCSSARMQEAMVASLLYLFDTAQRRELSKLNLRFLIAPYSDFHYKHHAESGEGNNTSADTTDDRELRLLCAKQALLTVLRSWNGVLHVMSCKILEDLVRVLLPCHLETRKSMLEFFYTLLRLPLPEWTDEFSVALLATDPSRVRDAWKLQEGYVAAEGKCLLPRISKFRPNLVLNHTALLVYCLVEARLVQTLVEVIVTSDTFISVRATILLGELLHLGSTLLPPSCHGTKMCLPQLVDSITSLKNDPVKRHRAAQAAAALSKIHQLKKKGIVPYSLALKQIVELERRASNNAKGYSAKNKKTEENAATVIRDDQEFQNNGEVESEMRSSRDPDGILSALSRDCGVLAQKDPLIWNWPVLSNLLQWSKMNSCALEDSILRSIIRRMMQFYKPSSNQFCQCEFSNTRTRLYSSVGCHLMDALTVVEEFECDKILSEFLDDVSSAIRDISQASSAHDCLLSPGRLSTTACQDYFLFIGRLSSTTNGINALEKAGIFQDLLELVASTNHDCYLKVIVSTLDFHTDGYARAILKKILLGPVDSGRIYATNHVRILLRAAEEYGTTSVLAKWAVPLLLGQLNDKSRAVVITAADILDEATDDPACIEVLIPLQTQFVQLIQEQEKQHLDSRARLLLIKTLSIPAGFKHWLETVTDSENGKVSLVQKELDQWISNLNIRYVQLVESDLADGLTQHQRAEDGRYGRLSNVRHAIRDLPMPPHLFSQLNQHREGLDFLRTSGQLSKLFSVVTNASIETDEEILELKAAVWACAHLGTSEPGVALLESAQVVEALVRIASFSSVLTLRGTAFFALNLIAMTSAGVDILAQFGWASIKRHHGELWHVLDDSEWNSLYFQHVSDPLILKDNSHLGVVRDRPRTVSQSSCHSVTFAADERDDTRAASILTSTPRQRSGSVEQPNGCWETDSQPYSLEGSSINFDSDSDHSSDVPTPEDAIRSCRRAYTLPLSVQTPGQEYVPHFRSFSDSHYTMADGVSCAVPTSPTTRPKRESRIWSKLRTSLRLRRSKRFSLPVRSSSKQSSFIPPETEPIQLLRSEPTDGAMCSTEETFSSSAAEEASSEEDDREERDTAPLHFEYQLNRIGSILSRLRSLSYKRRPRLLSSLSNRSGCYIGLCLPIQLSYLHPPADWFEQPVPPMPCTSFSNMTLNEEPHFVHQWQDCIVCSKDPSAIVEQDTSKFYNKQTEEEKWLVRKELLRLVTNMGSSVGLNANEQGLLRLKQRFPWAFHDVCLFSDVCHVMASHGYRLRARRFLHELFMDSPFDELYAIAVSRLKVDVE
ncbi:hypothetical protein GHT06_016757 [Daphnia sinensis]|uniref:Rapamycin-insensitive companion of mTOR n=1 Tax=Daphnia sinensis TaxID=1820382 RepID=A0AAD5PTA8_9CRUS|nr:hypothetical protein GHT06_016757 [Daphnia sinensis]